MDPNPYAKAPLCVVRAHPRTHEIISACCFLGGAPSTVVAAARRVRGGLKAPSWNAADAALLRGYYGAQWKSLLVPPPAPWRVDAALRARAARFYTRGDTELDEGAAALGGGDDDSFDPFGSTAAPAGTNVGDDLPDGDAPPDGASGPSLVYSPLGVYPEDTIYALRLKLQLATGVPLWRQHLFYYVDDEGPLLPYRVTCDGVPVAVDWRNLREPGAANVAGLPVEPSYEEHKSGLAVEAYDWARLLGRPGHRVTTACWVDIQDVLGKRSDAAQDEYLLDLAWYGCLVLYWPHLGRAGAARVLAGEPMRDCPALDPAAADLRARFQAERVAAERARTWRERASARPQVAVLKASVKVPPAAARGRVAIRNVFDWVETGPALSAVTARFMTGEGAAVGAKRHQTSYRLPAANKFVEGARARRGERADFMLVVPARGDERGVMYLSVYASGTYRAAGAWREDDRVQPPSVRADLGAGAQPHLAAINAMGAAAFPAGGRLGAVEEGELAELTACIYWPHSITIGGFRDLKEHFKTLEVAGLLVTRGLQLGDAYSLSWQRGVDYEAAGVPRRVAGEPALKNQYAWCTDAGAAERWAHYYGGRQLRIQHRNTDLRIELQGFSRDEFALVRCYLLAFLDGTGLARTAAKNPGAKDGRRAIRTLQERDPELFNLKRHDPAAGDYCRMCQGQRQPWSYTAEEAQRVHGRLTKYWNYTERAPAYYACPNSSYPFLSFRKGHPQGYCLPCCKKAKPPPGSRAAKYNEACLAAVAPGATGAPGAPAPADASAAQHVLRYGKHLEPGRLGELPTDLGRGLLYGLAEPPHGIYMVGVEQAAPSVPEAGFMYALGYALDRLRGGSDARRGVSRMAEAAAGLAASCYGTLGGGLGAAFASPAEMADALLDAFVRRVEGFTAFSPGGAAQDWHGIAVDLARAAGGFEVAEVQKDGQSLVMAGAGAARLAAGPAPLALVVTTPGGVFPVALVESARQAKKAVCVFTADSPAAAAAAVAETIQQAVSALQARAPGGFGLAHVTAFARASKRYRIVSRLIGTRGLCYGVLLRGETTQELYVPVHYSAAAADGTPVHYGRRPAPGPREDVEAVYEALRKFVASEGADLLARGADLVDAAGAVTGFVAGGLHWYHHPAAGASNASGAANASTTILVPYDPVELDEAVAAVAVRGPTPSPEVAEQAAQAQARHGLYRLFLAEFSAKLAAERNDVIRQGIAAALASTRYDDPESMRGLATKLQGALGEYPDDLELVVEAVRRGVSEAPQDVERRAASIIGSTAFGFDRLTLARLRAMRTHGERCAALREFMRDRVTAAPAVPSENIFTPCSAAGEHARHCVSGRLAVPADRLDELHEILAADVGNPLKAPMLAAMSSGVVDALEFIRRPGEDLRVVLEPGVGDNYMRGE